MKTASTLMPISNLLLGVALSLVPGCATEHYLAGRGDAGELIIKQTLGFDVAPATTNVLPKIEAKWRYFADQYGVNIRLPENACPRVEAFLRQAYGQPKAPFHESPGGGRIGTYRLTATGGVIGVVSSRREGTLVSVIRPLSKDEFAESVMRVITNRQFPRAPRDPR